jgi:hypothetical protein
VPAHPEPGPTSQICPRPPAELVNSPKPARSFIGHSQPAPIAHKWIDFKIVIWPKITAGPIRPYPARNSQHLSCQSSPRCLRYPEPYRIGRIGSIRRPRGWRSLRGRFLSSRRSFSRDSFSVGIAGVVGITAMEKATRSIAHQWGQWVQWARWGRVNGDREGRWVRWIPAWAAGRAPVVPVGRASARRRRRRPGHNGQTARARS